MLNLPLRFQLLQLDTHLGGRLPPEQFELARSQVTVPVLDLDAGDWYPDRGEPHPAHLGYMIVSGLMVRELEVGGARSIELLSVGDLLRPWLEDAASFVDARWRAVEPVRLAVLDPAATARAVRWPSLIAAIVDRGLRRSRSLAVSAALENIRGIDQRLWILFWHLAERWGRREADGSVVVPLRLTHETLAVLVGARRPTTSTALADLARRGQLERLGTDGWRLRGKPPSPREAA
jgi:CRP/FNR family transcriptional regulator, cyclic AMP receptor protein